MVFLRKPPKLLKQRRERLPYSRYLYNRLGGYLTGTVQGILLGLDALAETSLLEALASPTDVFVLWSTSPLYSSANSAEAFAASYLNYQVYRHGAVFIGMALTCMALACTTLNLYGTWSFLLLAWLLTCTVHDLCFFSFLEQAPCRIFQRFECRFIHTMLLRCLLYHNLSY